MPRTRNPYPAEFRDQLVALVRTGRSVESLAREFEPCAATIHGWVKQVACYLAEHANTLAPSSLARRVATLSKVHEANGWSNPCRAEIVRATLRGIKRVKGTARD